VGASRKACVGRKRQETPLRDGDHEPSGRARIECSRVGEGGETGAPCSTPDPWPGDSDGARAAAPMLYDAYVSQPAPVGDAFPMVYEHRERALLLAVAALLILLTHAVDVVQAGAAHWPAFGARLAWSLLLLATALALVHGKPGPIRVMAQLASLGTVLLYLLLVSLTGRSRSHLLSFTFVLVMVLPIVMPELIALALCASALLLGGAWTMFWLDGAGLGEMLGWGHVGLVALGIAALLGHALRRARLAELTQTEARVEAQVKLAESERRLAEEDKLAALGRLAGEIAHEINSPLAAARSTATYLRDRLPEGDSEGREAGRDLVGSLDRVAESVRRLRRDSRP
jgi:signal transduction histidine kinase